MIRWFFRSPQREYFLILLAISALSFDFFVRESPYVILAIALLFGLLTLIRAFFSLLDWGVSVDLLHLSAFIVLFATAEIHSVIVIGGVLALGRLFGRLVSSVTDRSLERYRKQAPKKAYRQNGNVYDEIPVERIRSGDILIVKEEQEVPVDGIIVFGKASVNEGSVTGESKLVKKVLGDKIFSSATIVSGTVKIRAMCTNKDSMFFQKVKFMKSMGGEKMHSLYLSDRLAEYFLPFVFFAGIVIYLVTDDLLMTTAFFLVVCDGGIMFVIPYIFKRSFNTLAECGVIIKNNKKFEALGKAAMIIFNKTDKLTFGSFQIKKVFIEEGVSNSDFWTSIAIAERYSEDILDKILFREALEHIQTVPDAYKYQIYKGAGMCVRYGCDNIMVGNKKLLLEKKISLPRGFKKKFEKINNKYDHTTIFVAINNIFIGCVVIVDMPANNVLTNVKELSKIGVKKTVLLTNNNETVTRNTATAFGIDKFYPSLTQEGRISKIKQLSKTNFGAVVGDGSGVSNIAGAGVDIAIGKECSAISGRSSDIIILNDNLDLLPKLIMFSRRLTQAIYGNIGIWFIINLCGVILVFTGIVGPVSAVLYSLLANSAHLIPLLRLSRSNGATIKERNLV